MVEKDFPAIFKHNEQKKIGKSLSEFQTNLDQQAN